MGPGDPPPLLQGAVSAAGVTLELVLEQPEAGRRQLPTIVIHYQPLIPAPDNSPGYVRLTVRLEFAAHSTGEPHGLMPISCEAATHLAMLDFPTAAAVHVACRKGRWGSGEGERYSRHWYDLDRLARAGIAEAARQALEANDKAMTESGMLRGRPEQKRPLAAQGV